MRPLEPVDSGLTYTRSCRKKSVLYFTFSQTVCRHKDYRRFQIYRILFQVCPSWKKFLEN